MINKTASGDTVQQIDTENQEGSDAVQRISQERRRPQTAIPRPRSSPRTLSPSPLAVPRISQEVMRNAIEVCQTGMVLVDHTGVIVLVNVEVERLFGYKRCELIGQPIDTLLPANLRNQHASHRKAYTAHPKTCMGLGRVLSGLHRDGSLLDMEVGLNAIDTREGLLVLCAITDVRERKRRERLKDEFVATVSHELRTPVTSISASIGLLCGNAAGPLPGAAESLLRIAYKNCQRLGQLLNDILDIDKLQSGKVAFNSARIEVRGLVQEAVEANTGLADRAGVRVRLEGASAAGEIFADRERLMQAVTNLLSNAIKFSPPGGEVIVATEKGSKTVRISVQDHGCGIPKDFKRCIFEKFAQADGSNTRQKVGSGLGLSIVKEIVTRLGGNVGFDDAPGGGTIFHVELPDLDHQPSWLGN
jgi:PAS domain S-box-containing protein